jgi:hypothetical protein
MNLDTYLNPNKKIIVRSRDVIITEDETLNDIEKPDKLKTTTPQVILAPVNPSPSTWKS